MLTISSHNQSALECVRVARNVIILRTTVLVLVAARAERRKGISHTDQSAGGAEPNAFLKRFSVAALSASGTGCPSAAALGG